MIGKGKWAAKVEEKSMVQPREENNGTVAPLEVENSEETPLELEQEQRRMVMEVVGSGLDRVT